MKTTWGKKIGFLVAAGVLFVGLLLFVPQEKSFAFLACPPGQHLVEGVGCVADTVECPAGSHPVEGVGCVADTQASTATGGYQVPKTVSCGVTEIQCWVGSIFYYTIYVTFGFLVWVSASFLDLIINITILQFHTWAGLPGVKIAWTVLRDTMNITFIFLLLYASISMILGLGKEKGIVKGVILAGLLINFSFFFTSVIIDASNVLTVQMHEAVQKIGDNIAQGASGGIGVTGTQKGITAVFMRGTGIQVADIRNIPPSAFMSKLFQQMLFSSIEFLVLAFIFFAMGFLLLGRFVVLLILLITSPISVMGGLFPQIAEQSKKWWKTLIDQATFAPIMMLFLVVTAVVISNEEFRRGFSSGNTGAPDSVPGLLGGVGGLVQYGIVIGLLVVSIVVAKKSSGAASNGVSDWAIKKAQSVATAPGRWVGATAGAVGAAAGVVAGGVSGAAGRFGVKTIVNPLSSKYDLAMGKLAQSDNKWKRGVATAAGGLGIDEGIRDTFKGAAALKFGSQASLAEREKQVLQRKKELGQAVKDAETEKTIDTGIREIEGAMGTRGFNSDGTNTKIKAYLDAVAKITDREIEEMLATGDLDKLKKLAPDLSARHMDKIKESTIISDSDKGGIAKARVDGMKARLDVKNVAGGAAGIHREAKRIASGKANDVAQLPAEILKNPEVASMLSVATLAKIATDANVNDKRELRKTIIDRYEHFSLVGASTPEELAQAENLDNLYSWLTSDAGRIF